MVDWFPLRVVSNNPDLLPVSCNSLVTRIAASMLYDVLRHVRPVLTQEVYTCICFTADLQREKGRSQGVSVYYIYLFTDTYKAHSP